jgi:hypothetical protein
MLPNETPVLTISAILSQFANGDITANNAARLVNRNAGCGNDKAKAFVNAFADLTTGVPMPETGSGSVNQSVSVNPTRDETPKPPARCEGEYHTALCDAGLNAQTEYSLFETVLIGYNLTEPDSYAESLHKERVLAQYRILLHTLAEVVNAL